MAHRTQSQSNRPEPSSAKGGPTEQNEGEGSRSAARNYDARTREYVRTGRVGAAAENAKRALEGPEADAMKKAEAEGRAGNPPKRGDGR